MEIPVDKFVLSFSRSDWDLILEYGYAPLETREILASAGKTSKEIEIEYEGFEVGFLLGDLARSTLDCSDPIIIEDLDRIYTRIEWETQV